MEKKGGFFGGLIVFILILVILGGVGYLGFNIIKNGAGMGGMNMASGTSDGNNATAADKTDNNTDTVSNQNGTGGQNAIPTDGYKISQINQVMLNKEALDKAYETINSALSQMTLDPYASDDKSAAGSNTSQSADSSGQSDASGTQSDTTVNIYTGDITSGQTVQMQSMGQTYDPDKMQQLHTGLYKVSVGMQLLKQLQDNIALQAEQSGTDSSVEAQYYVNQYYNTIQDRNKLDSALNYINEAVDLININPYVDANGLVYDKDRMTQLHNSIFTIAQGVVDLNQLDDALLSQAVKIGALAQDAYNRALQNNTNNMNNMNMSGSGINITTIISFVLIAFVVVFILGLLGSIIKLFKSGNHKNSQIS